MFDLTQEYGHSHIRGAWHLVYYLPKFRPIGSFSDNILKFKESNTPYVNCWAFWTYNELKKINTKFDMIVRALGSTELQVSKPKGLDILGSYLSRSLPSIYDPYILQKNRVTPSMHTLKTKVEREAAIHGSFFVAKKDSNLNYKNILILDDVTTTKTTLNEILRALREVWGNANYYFFCLGRTAYDEKLNDGITTEYFKSLAR